MPAKELRCKECDTYVGEIKIGKIHKRAVVLCETCEGARQFSKIKNPSDSPDVPDFLKGLFG